MKYKFAVKGLAVFCAVSLMAGCWDKREINDLNLLLAAAVDPGKQKKYAVTFQCFSTAASSGGNSTAQPQTSVLSYTVEGDSIKEADREFTKISSRIPVYSHLEVFVIGNGLANKGIQEFLDRFGRDVQLRRTKYLLVAEENGEDILQATTPFETPGTDIREILERTNQSSEYYLVNYNDFMAHYTDPDLLSFLPVIHAVPSKGIKRTNGNQAKNTLELEGMAFFEKDRMVTQLNGNETRAWLFTQGNITKGTSVKWKGREQETAVLQTTSQSRRFEIDLSGFPISVTLKIRTAGVIAETSGSPDLLQPNNLHKLKEELEATIKNQIEQLIRKSQKEKKDILLLGREIRSYQPNKWNELKNDWADIYSSAKFRVEVHVDIKNTGMLRKNFIR